MTNDYDTTANAFGGATHHPSPSYGLILSAVRDEVWAILPSKFADIKAVLAFRASGGRLSAEELEEIIGAAPIRPKPRRNGAVAVVPVFGIIHQRMNMMSQMSGGTSTEQLTAQIREAVNNADVGTVVLDIDSPGGGVNGIQELATEMLQMRERKPIIAVVNSLAASAAYWIAASASEVVITPSGDVGSIGVFAAHEDISQRMENEGVKVTLISAGKFKTEGNPFEPLSDEALEALQGRVDEAFGTFVASVAKGRGVSVSDVRTGFGQGRVVGAKDALREGMVDRIATFDQTMERLGVPVGSPSQEKAEDPAMLRRRIAMMGW